jgi:hypothetical protein
LGGLLFLAVFVAVGPFVGPDPAQPAGAIMRFPDIRAARTVEDGLYLAVLVLFVMHSSRFIGHSGNHPRARAVQERRGIIGLVVPAAGALPYVARRQAPRRRIWQAIQGVFDALLITGLGFLPIGLILLGSAMLGSGDFGRALGMLSLGLDDAGLVAAAALLVDPLSPLAFIGVSGAQLSSASFWDRSSTVYRECQCASIQGTSTQRDRPAATWPAKDEGSGTVDHAEPEGAAELDASGAAEGAGGASEDRPSSRVRPVRDVLRPTLRRAERSRAVAEGGPDARPAGRPSPKSWLARSGIAAGISASLTTRLP